MADCFALLVNGSLLEAMLCPFINVFEQSGLAGGWFYAIGLFTVITMIYIKSRDITLVAMIGLLGGSAMSMLLPEESLTVAYIVIALSIVGVLYSLAKGR